MPEPRFRWKGYLRLEILQKSQYKNPSHACLKSIKIYHNDEVKPHCKHQHLDKDFSLSQYFLESQELFQSKD